MTKNKSKIRNYTWWICGIIGLIIGLAKADGRINGHGAMAIVGVTNGIFWGWIIGYIIDKINDSNNTPSDKKESDGLMDKMQSQIFPNGNAQIEKEINEVRILLDFKYTKEEVKRTYIHAAAIFYVSGGNDIERITTSILHHEGSVVTKDDAQTIYLYLKSKFNKAPQDNLASSVFKSNSDAGRLFLIIKGGIVELKRAYKDLDNDGKFEVILYNSALALNGYYNNHRDKYESTKNEVYELIIKQANEYQINVDKDRLLKFIDSRVIFYLQEIEAMVNIENYIPALVYSNFYVKPLAKPESNGDFIELLQFQVALPKMVDWVVANTDKV